MINDFTKITELKSISELKSTLMRKELELSKPWLTDLEHIPEIYKCFCEKYNCCGTLRKKANPQFKREFIFIILLLYSPNTLADNKKIVNGVRRKVAQVLGFNSPSAVSNLCANVADWYSRYEDYQHDIDCLYGIILNYLKAERLIK